MGPVAVTFLGTGDAFHAGGRNSSSYLLDAGGVRVAVDCGPTTPLALHRAGVSPGSLHGVLQTHFHGDHVLGLPMQLLHHQYLAPAGHVLECLGPDGLESLVMNIYEAVYPNAARKLATEMAGRVKWRTIRPGQTRDLPGGAGQVKAFPVAHNPESLGYRIETRGRTIAFTGDTKWSDALPELAAGADLLVIDCTFLDRPIGDHLCFAEIAERAGELGAERIVLSHLSAEVQTSRRRFPMTRARDGMVIEL